MKKYFPNSIILQLAGSWTVFVPSDAAFIALPRGALEGLLKDRKALKKCC